MHNTAQVDGEEINRLHDPDNLWNLHDDARARLLNFVTSATCSEFSGEHSGYRRLADPVGILRNISLHHQTGTLTIEDIFDAKGAHTLTVPLHLSPEAHVDRKGGRYFVVIRDKCFDLSWEGEGWQIRLEEGSASPSYGVRTAVQKLVWKTQSSGSERLKVIIKPLRQRECH